MPLQTLPPCFVILRSGLARCRFDQSSYYSGDCSFIHLFGFNLNCVPSCLRIAAAFSEIQSRCLHHGAETVAFHPGPPLPQKVSARALVPTRLLLHETLPVRKMGFKASIRKATSDNVSFSSSIFFLASSFAQILSKVSLLLDALEFFLLPHVPRIPRFFNSSKIP